MTTARSPRSPNATMTFYLEHAPHPHGPVERITLTPLPFRIGRGESNHFRLPVPVVSNAHALFFAEGDGCFVQDLQSTNGTFVNGTKVVQYRLTDGDIVQLGPVELLFRVTSAAISPAVCSTQALPLGVAPGPMRAAAALQEMIAREAVETVFQPIVNLHTRAVIGYEALARGAHPGVPRTPVELFRIAEACGLAAQLSQLLRRLALRAAAPLPAALPLFLNVHHYEVDDASFLGSVEMLQRENVRRRPLVMEIAEASVTDVDRMRALARGLALNVVRFAYDDFGAGQARLVELTDVPPHYLKLDRMLIRGIDGSRARRDVIAALAHVVHDSRVQIIAEGIETEPVAAICRDTGCELGQGFLWGMPGPLPDAADEKSDTSPALAPVRSS